MNRTTLFNVVNDTCCGNNNGFKECFETFLMENEIELLKGNLLATFKRISKEYFMSFDIKPTGFLGDYSGVIRLTIGNDNSRYGDRIPAVIFRRNSSGVVDICSSLSNNRNTCFGTTRLKPGSWSTFQISQKFVDGQYIYSVQLNGSKIAYVNNNNATEFFNVKLYISDPWYDAQPGFIRNVKVSNGNSTLCRNQNNASDVFAIMCRTRYCNVQNTLEWGFENKTEIKNCFVNQSFPDLCLQWSEWSSCNLSCVTSRSRNCSNCLNCKGNKIEFEKESCNFLYEVYWSSWSICKVSNGNGVMSRTKLFNVVNDTSCGNSNGVKECFEIFWMENEIEMSKKNLLATFKRISKEYSISFDIKPTDFLDDWTSVIRLTIGNYNSRIPAVFFRKNDYGVVQICSSFNNDKCFTSKPIDLGSWSTFLISQKFVEGNYMFLIQLNGTNITYIKNTNATEFVDVKLYVSDPWFNAQPGFIRNLKVSNGNPASFKNQHNASDIFAVIYRTRWCNVQNDLEWGFENKTEIKNCLVNQTYPESYGRGIYWDNNKSHIYVCMSQHMPSTTAACYHSNNNGCLWDNLDAQVGSILGHHTVTNELYAIHRNRKTYIVFHSIHKKWLALTIQQFNEMAVDKIDPAWRKNLEGDYEQVYTLGPNDWLGNAEGLFYRKHGETSWIQRVKWVW